MTICFIDQIKDFDNVEQLIILEQHKQSENYEAFDSFSTSPTHRKISQVHVDYGTTDCLPIQKRIRQGCILTPGLCNLCSEYIKMTVGVGDMVNRYRKSGEKNKHYNTCR